MEKAQRRGEISPDLPSPQITTVNILAYLLHLRVCLVRVCISYVNLLTSMCLYFIRDIIVCIIHTYLLTIFLFLTILLYIGGIYSCPEVSVNMIFSGCVIYMGGPLFANSILISKVSIA